MALANLLPHQEVLHKPLSNVAVLRAALMVQETACTFLATSTGFAPFTIPFTLILECAVEMVSAILLAVANNATVVVILRITERDDVMSPSMRTTVHVTWAIGIPRAAIVQTRWRAFVVIAISFSTLPIVMALFAKTQRRADMSRISNHT